MAAAFCASALSLSARVRVRTGVVSSLRAPLRRPRRHARRTTHLPAGLRQTGFHGVNGALRDGLLPSSTNVRALAAPPGYLQGGIGLTSVSSEAHNNAEVIPHDLVEELRARFDDLANVGGLRAEKLEKLISEQFAFPLDDFQRESLVALTKGESVVLSAPTGAGKTVVGEIAVFLALCRKLRVFYTTPLKALSNQKFYDFKKQFGEHRVGLLTGDVTVNRNAEIVVMTTEVYRNMLYAESTEARDSSMVTDKLFAVVFDEFHYLNDRDRGTVWEESVINSPDHVLLVALSATMSNTDDVKEWFQSVQGPTSLVQSVTRPVPLNFAYCDHEGMTPLFADSTRTSTAKRKKGFGRKGKEAIAKSSQTEKKLHPKLLRGLKGSKDDRDKQSRRRRGSDEDPAEKMQGKYRDIASRAKQKRRDRYVEIPSFPFVVRNLRRRKMLPCIVFIFSRAGCDRAAVAAASEREELVSDNERDRIRVKLDTFVAENPGMVQPDRLDLVMQGIASHHAGLLPLWKLCVEELFQDGLIKVVFATETLAAGINMPARTTVISSLSKRAGEQGFVSLTTSEVLQMAGRAGRRGKDVVGHSMVLRSRNEGALEAFKVLTSDVDALESKFTPNYGMVLNLLSARPLDDAKKLVDRSFGNFLRQKEMAELGSEQEGNHVSDEERAKLMREREAVEAVWGDARKVLESVDDSKLQAYVKSLERVKAEKRALAYLVQQSTETDTELIEDTIAFAPPGTRILLKEQRPNKSNGAERRSKRRKYSAAIAAASEGDLGAELKEFYLGASDPELEDIDNDDEDKTEAVIEAVLLDMHSESAGVLPTFAAVDAEGSMRLFTHNAVSRLFYEEEPIDVESLVTDWKETVLPPRSEWKPIRGDQFSAPMPEELRNLKDVVRQWREERRQAARSGADKADRSQQHPEVYAQQARVQHAKDTVKKQELHKREDIATILAAKRAIPKLEATLNGTMDPFGNRRRRRRGGGRTRYVDIQDQKDSNDGDAQTRAAYVKNSSWDEFMSLVSVLQQYGFLDDSYNVTSLGSIGAKVKSENELWTSLMMLQPALERVSPMHLGAIVGASQMEPSRSDVYIEYQASQTTRDTVATVAVERARLQAVQSSCDVDMPIFLDADLMGLVEMWATGVSWVELLRGTSLQEGDACRILRRVLDMLRQIQYLPVVSEKLKRNAKRAVALLDRFPVTDERTYVVRDDERDDGD